MFVENTPAATTSLTCFLASICLTAFQAHPHMANLQTDCIALVESISVYSIPFATVSDLSSAEPTSRMQNPVFVSIASTVVAIITGVLGLCDKHTPRAVEA